MAEIRHPLSNAEVGSAFREFADLLEIGGANPFRVRAYRNAIKTIQGLTRPLKSMVQDGEDLTELPGVGKDISAQIVELFENGDLSGVQELEATTPRELATLVRIEGLGPKKVAKLHEELGVVTPEDLERVLKSGAAGDLPGFGQKTVEKLKGALEDFRSHQDRFLLAQVDDLMGPLLEHLQAAPGVVRLELAGSTRRRRETVGDVDVLVQCDGDRGAIVQHFTAYPGASRVESSGETRGRIRLRSGLSVDLRVLPGDSYGAALHYFTGSKEHNVALRARAVKAGLRVNEYGVFRTLEGGGAAGDDPDRGERVAGDTEESVYAALGLPWIPPELRENRGEIQAAEAGTLPRLVRVDDLKGDLHMHTVWSDGKRSIREMVEACADRGYEYLAITDHSQAVTVANGLGPERLREQWEAIEEVRSEIKGIEILRGCEVDILKDGSMDMPDEELQGLDWVIAAVHSHMDMDEGTMTRRVIRALEHPSVNMLAHPTGRLLNRRQPFAIDMEAVLTAAVEHRVAVEINANPLRLDLNEVLAGRARELGVPVVVNTDAHDIRQLEYVTYGIDQARRAWLEAPQVLNTWSFRTVKKWLKGGSPR
jgi:DNA polymerase (family 10)